MATKGTLKYRRVSRTPQVGKDAGKKKFYATAVQDRTLEFEDFVTHISEHNSPYSRGTIHGVLMDTLDCLQELILDGKSVRLADLGLFSVGMTSRGEATADKVNANSIIGVHLIVRNTKSWSNAQLRKACKISALDGSVTEDDGGTDNPGGGNASTPSGGGTSGDNKGEGGGSQGSGTGAGGSGSSGSGTTEGDHKELD